jgi:transposase
VAAGSRRQRAEPRRDREARQTARAADARRAARLLTDAPEALSDDDRRFVAALRERSPTVAVASDLIGRFAAMVKKRTPEGFNGWLREAEDSALASFAAGVRRDEDAARAAPEAPVRSKGASTG